MVGKGALPFIKGRCCQQARTGTGDKDGSEEGTASPPPLPLPRPHPSPPLPEGQAACGGPQASFSPIREADFWKTSHEPGALAHPRAAQEAFDERSAWMD